MACPYLLKSGRSARCRVGILLTPSVGARHGVPVPVMAGRPRYLAGIAVSREWLKHDLVDVTPSPVFARLKGSGDRVLGLTEMLGGVPVF